MKRLLRLAICAAVLAPLGLGHGLACRSSSGGARPNIIVIVIDSLRYDALGCNGGPADASPRIDALARRGVRFSQARSQASWTVPSLSSLVSGCYPGEHRQAVSVLDLDPRCPNVATAFAAKGYTTGAVADIETPMLHQGFGSFDTPSGGFKERALLGKNNLADVSFRRAADWVRNHRNSPFFLFVHTYEVHDYFIGKRYARKAARLKMPGYQGRFQTWALRYLDVGAEVFRELASASDEDLAFLKQLYLAELGAADEAVGYLMDTLQELELDGQTLVVVTADHGEGFDREARRFHHSGRLHDDLLHVPLVLSWPGQLAPAVSDRPVELVDLASTLLTVAGVSPSTEPLHGRPLIKPRPEAQRSAGREPWVVETESGEWNGWAEECCWVVDANGIGKAQRAPQAAIIVPPHKLIWTERTTVLYDLEADPLERRNLAASASDVREDLEGRLRSRIARFGKSPEGSEAERNELLRSLGYVK